MDDVTPTHDLAMAGVTGAILMGGGSRRMGVPKSALRVPEDGPTMLERVVSVLLRCCDEVVLVGRHPGPLPASLRGLESLVDEGNGPLSGLAAALASSRYSHVMLAACDMPFMSAGVVQEIIARSVASGVGVIPEVAGDDGSRRLQPLHAVYLKAQLPSIQLSLAQGARSMVTAATRLDMMTWTIDEKTAGEELVWSFFNVNTPADLAAARQHALDLQRRSQGAILETNNLDRRE